MAATRIISIIGKKDAGKTTLVVALATEMRRKLRVMTLKHGTHAADMDQKGKDTWRHWNEGKAERVLLEAPTTMAIPSPWRGAISTAPTSSWPRGSRPIRCRKSKSTARRAVKSRSTTRAATTPISGSPC